MNAIVVTNINRDDSFRYCYGTVERYCDRYDIAIEEITTPVYDLGRTKAYNYMTFEKNQVFRLFDEYDRILRLDADTLITNRCPDVFGCVADECVGVVYEDVGSRRVDRLHQIKLAKSELGDVEGWPSGYFNSGVVACSKEHREIFRLEDRELAEIRRLDLGPFKEQTYLNWKVRHHRTKIQELDYRWNHLSLFSEGKSDAEKFDSYIIHYAGGVSSKRSLARDYVRVMNDWR